MTMAWQRVNPTRLRQAIADLNTHLQKREISGGDTLTHDLESVRLIERVWAPLQAAEEELDILAKLKRDLIGDPFRVIEELITPQIRTPEQAAEVIKGCVLLLNRMVARFYNDIQVSTSSHVTGYGIGVTVTKKVVLTQVESPRPDPEEEVDLDDI